MEISGTQYPILSYNGDSIFYISGYTSGDAAGVNLSIYKRLVDGQIGYLTYKGLTLVTGVDYESNLSIVNGANPPVTVLEDSNFKENFLILIDNNYYFINEINGTTITLGGIPVYWKTTGTTVDFIIYRYVKQSATIDDYTFRLIDRSGSEIITSDTEFISLFNTLGLSMDEEQEDKKDPNFNENMEQNEGITFTIEYNDGTNLKGQL